MKKISQNSQASNDKIVQLQNQVHLSITLLTQEIQELFYTHSGVFLNTSSGFVCLVRLVCFNLMFCYFCLGREV